MAKGEGLVYFKWNFDKSDYLELAVNTGLCTEAEGYQIFVAVQNYAKTGETRSFPNGTAELVYRSLCLDVDHAVKKYHHRSEINQENGSKGGKAKAAKAAARAGEAISEAETEDTLDVSNTTQEDDLPTIPPTLAQFKIAVNHITETKMDNKAAFCNADVEAFFAELDGAGWIWRGRSVSSWGDLEKLIAWKFSTEEFNGVSMWDAAQRWSELASPALTILGISDSFSWFLKDYRGKEISVFAAMNEFAVEMRNKENKARQDMYSFHYIPGKQ